MGNLEIVFKGIKKSDIEHGMQWYKKANKFADHLSNQFQVDFNKVCAVISALSPACNWGQNKKDAKMMLICYINNLNYADFNFSTYGPNVAKAWNILNSTNEPIDFFNLKTGAKTYNFYLNILNPLDINFVTIDRHAISVYKGTKRTNKSLTVKQYGIIADAYTVAAYNLGILPCELQAILWTNHVTNVLGN